MLRPVLSASIGEKSLARLMTVKNALNSGISTMSADECPMMPVSPLPPTTVPPPPPRPACRWKAPPAHPREKNAATGKDRKLAAARPSAASSAIQQKMMPSPRAKFRAKPPFGIQHLHAVFEREQQRGFVRIDETDGQHALVVKQVRPEFETHGTCPAPGSSAPTACTVFSAARRPATSRRTCRTELSCAALNLTRSCKWFVVQEIFGESQVNPPCRADSPAARAGNPP